MAKVLVTGATGFIGFHVIRALVRQGHQLTCLVRKKSSLERLAGLEFRRLDGDVRDVMGELANMVAGNLKSLLPRGVDLSMPSVIEGSDYSLHICGVGAVERMSFSSAPGDFRITLLEMMPPA